MSGNSTFLICLTFWAPPTPRFFFVSADHPLTDVEKRRIKWSGCLWDLLQPEIIKPTEEPHMPEHGSLSPPTIKTTGLHWLVSSMERDTIGAMSTAPEWASFLQHASTVKLFYTGHNNSWKGKKKVPDSLKNISAFQALATFIICSKTIKMKSRASFTINCFCFI